MMRGKHVAAIAVTAVLAGVGAAAVGDTPRPAAAQASSDAEVVRAAR